MGNLDGQIAIVTGGASGIGLATVKAFVDRGAKVVIADYNEKAGKEVEKSLLEKEADVLFIKADVSAEESVKNLVAETVKIYGKLDIIINNAGVGTLSPTHELSFEDYN